jgi:aspartyl-tRNA(Asn)/glutamyl-tRNA(Gln) amidotransferase subunit C
VISREAVEHAARLARLQLGDAELEQLRDQLSGILQFVDQLARLDTAAVAPTSHAVPLVNVMRDDVVEPCLPREAMLANAPDPDGEFFRVPRIIED